MIFSDSRGNDYSLRASRSRGRPRSRHPNVRLVLFLKPFSPASEPIAHTLYREKQKPSTEKLAIPT